MRPTNASPAQKRHPWLLVLMVALSGTAVLVAVVAFKQGGMGQRRVMTVAQDLIAVHGSMKGISGFLPGNHRVLSQRLRERRFTSVIVLPEMVSATHMADVFGVDFGTSLVLLKTNEMSKSWKVSRDVFIGSKYWKSDLGTLNEP